MTVCELEAEESVERRAYEAPKLEELGSLLDLTGSGKSPTLDDDGGSVAG